VLFLSLVGKNRLLKTEANKNLSDEELVHRYRNSHETAYIGELYQRYTHLVYGVCMKYLHNEAEAEDMTMQIFEKLITDLKKHHITVFKSWLHMVVKNHCMMHFRKETNNDKKRTKLSFTLGAGVENKEDEHLLEKEEKEKERKKEEEDKEFVLQHLKEGMDELKEEQRECIELFYVKDCSYNEIAAMTGYSINEVKSHLQNGKRNLKKYISSKKNEEEDRANDLS